MRISLANTKLPDCNICKERKYYLQRNCTGGDNLKPIIRDKTIHYNIDKDTIINYCPKLVFLNEEVIEVLTLYNLFQKGILYDKGAYLDQPFWYIQAMLTLEGIKNTYERESLESKRSS